MYQKAATMAFGRSIVRFVLETEALLVLINEEILYSLSGKKWWADFGLSVEAFNKIVSADDKHSG